MKLKVHTLKFLYLQGMYDNGMARQGNQQQQQQMYPGARGYGAMPGQYQAGYNGFNGNYPQQQGANNMAAYQQQQQQFQPGYNQQHPGYPQQQQQQQWYPNGQGYDQSNWSQQQQQHMGWNNGMNQWNNGQQQSQQQPANWANNMSPRNEANPQNLYNNSTQQQMPAPAAVPAAKDPKAAGAGAKTNVEMQPEAYQRTLEYVQQCQSWSNTSVMSPDSSNGAKPKRSPPHSADGAAAAAAMPPPMNGAMPARPADNTSNMIIGDMSSSMNILNEETRFLHMMQ